MDQESMGPEGRIAAIASLHEPVRRALYLHIARQGGSVGRTEAADAVGISRALAAFHLDKLVEEGLLEAHFQRLTGRLGPGAGRPSKLYRRAQQELIVSLPPRSYELAARLFARALDREGVALHEVAREFGEDLGAATREIAGPDADREALLDAAEVSLTAYGFEPFRNADGAIHLRNCPFHALAEEHRAMVCGMNHSLMSGLVEGLRLDGMEAVLDPHPGMCCVTFRPSAAVYPSAVLTCSTLLPPSSGDA